MAITIDRTTKIINVPKADMTLIQSSPIEIRQLDLDAFRLELKDIEDDEEGIAFLDTHSHNAPVSVGGVTLARVISIINGYTVTFENGIYAVKLAGANSNVADVTNLNFVSIRSANSAGLVLNEETAASDVADAVLDELLSSHTVPGSLSAVIAEVKDDTDTLLSRLTLARAITLDSIPGIESNTILVRQILKNRLELQDGSANNWILYDDDNVTPLLTWNVTDKNGVSIILPDTAPANREPV